MKQCSTYGVASGLDHNEIVVVHYLGAHGTSTCRWSTDLAGQGKEKRSRKKLLLSCSRCCQPASPTPQPVHIDLQDNVV